MAEDTDKQEAPRTPQPPKMDPKVLVYRAEIEKLDAKNAEILAKYETARCSLEKQLNVANGLSARLKRNEALLSQEQARLQKANEIIGNYQKQWAKVVQSEQKLRADTADFQQKLSDAEKDCLQNRNDKTAALTELTRIKTELARQTKAFGDLQAKHLQLQSAFLQAEKRGDEQIHRAAMLDRELEATRASLAASEKIQAELRNQLSETRFRIDQLTRESERSTAGLQETKKLLEEANTREEACRRDIAVLEAKRSELESLLKAEHEALFVTKTKLSDAEKACDHLISERTDLVKRGDAAYVESSQLKKRLEESARAAREEKQILTLERDRALQAVSRLEAEIAMGTHTSEVALAHARSQAESLSLENNRLHGELRKSNLELETQKAAHHAAREDIAKSQVLYDNLMKERTDLVRRGDLAYEEVARLQKKLDETRAHASQVADEMRSESESAHLLAGELQAALSQTKSELRRLSEERIETESRNSALTAEIERCKREIASMQEEATTRDQREEELHRELQHARELAQQLSEDRAKLQDESMKTRANLLESQRALLEAKDETRIAKAEAENIKAAVAREMARTDLQQELLLAYGKDIDEPGRYPTV